MTGKVFDIRSFSVHDGPGIRTTIFLKGCPLHCAWCHNPEGICAEIQQIKQKLFLGEKQFVKDKNIGFEISVADIFKQIISDRPFFENSNGGITLSGGEPLLQPEFTIAILEEAKKHDIHTAIDTCGFAKPEIFQSVVKNANLVLFDLKIMNDELHKKFTGVSNEIILNNLEWLSAQNIPIIIRIPLIQNITDTDENIADLRTIINKNNNIQRIDFLPYHSLARKKYENLNLGYSFAHLESYPKEKLKFGL